MIFCTPFFKRKGYPYPFNKLYTSLDHIGLRSQPRKNQFADALIRNAIATYTFTMKIFFSLQITLYNVEYIGEMQGLQVFKWYFLNRCENVWSSPRFVVLNFDKARILFNLRRSMLMFVIHNFGTTSSIFNIRLTVVDSSLTGDDRTMTWHNNTLLFILYVTIYYI